jgi:anti-sigma B factor antagonist
MTLVHRCLALREIGVLYGMIDQCTVLVGKKTMPIEINDLGGGVTVVRLSGRIDIAGAREIDMPMNIIAGSKRNVVLDLSAVDFLASLGIRSIVVAAKSIASKRGICVMFGPTPDVRSVLEASAIDTVIPIHDGLDDAIRAVSPR